MSKKLPVLLATPVIEDGKVIQWKAWCPFCTGYHFHSPEPGHRVAHCHNENSPFQESGYILRLETRHTSGKARSEIVNPERN